MDLVCKIIAYSGVVFVVTWMIVMMVLLFRLYKCGYDPRLSPYDNCIRMLEKDSKTEKV